MNPAPSKYLKIIFIIEDREVVGLNEREGAG